MNWFLFPAAAPDFAASSFDIRSLFIINQEVCASRSRRRETRLEIAGLLGWFGNQTTVKVVSHYNIENQTSHNISNIQSFSCQQLC